MEEKIKKGLLVFVLVILLLPCLQQCFPVIDSGVLHGYFTNAENTHVTLSTWFDGSYQVAKGNFQNDHVGFRPDLLRLNSQIDYTLFRKLDYGGTSLGSDDYLFYDNYIDAYFGRDYVGYPALHDRMMKLKALQDTFARCGKSLIMVYCPCKAWYFPEHIPPDSYFPKGTANNYLTAARIGDSLGINQIDFNKWFLAMKDTTKEILYSRQGIHWTNYGSIIASDSLIKYIEQLRHIRMLHPYWNKVEHSTEGRMPDNDMAVILNLIFPAATDTFCYPELQFGTDTTVTRPNCIYIGDSYVINLLRMDMIQHMNANWQFWFYFRNLLNDSNWYTDNYTKIAEYDWSSELLKTDCIILMYTPMNTANLGDGFIEQAYDFYFPKK